MKNNPQMLPTEREEAASRILLACAAMGINLKTNHGTHQENAWQLGAQAIDSRTQPSVQGGDDGDEKAVERLIEAGSRLVAWIQQNSPDAGKGARADWFEAVAGITTGGEGGE